jgi:hypothetical protein
MVPFDGTGPGQQQQVSSGRGGNGGGMNGKWQTDRDTPHRREMIQHM